MERGKRIEERPRPLSAVFVKSVKKPGRYSDGPGGHGLSLLVKPGWRGRMAKSWSQRLRINGQAFNIGLGSYPVVTLSSAREVALENRRAVAHGKDPRTPPADVPTFAEAVDAVIAERSPGWKSSKTPKRWRARMDTYAIPTLGSKLVTEITTSDVLAVLLPIWVEKPETGRQVRENTSVIMEWVIGQNHRSDNPASKAILKSLSKQSQRVKHFRALPHAEVGPAIRRISATDGHPTTKLAFEYLAYTAARSGEARLAKWSEVDLEDRVWIVPESRMKNRLEHKVPLSENAVDVLRRAQEFRDGSGLIFPSARGKAMSDSTISKLLREHQIGTTPHGLRSSFRDWAAECTDVPREIAEFALAHVMGSEAELAYRRTDYFERRRKLMDDWAEYLAVPLLAGPRETGESR